MVMLISGIIAIALFAVIMVAGSGSFSADAIVRRETAHKVQSSIANIGNAFQAYRIANNGARPTQQNWKIEMADYAPSRSPDQMARPIHGMEWSYNLGPNRSWFCLSGQNVDRAVIQALASSAREAGSGKLTLAAACPESGSQRAVDEASCAAPAEICSAVSNNSPAPRALILYPQG